MQRQRSCFKIDPLRANKVWEETSLLHTNKRCIEVGGGIEGMILLCTNKRRVSCILLYQSILVTI